MDLKGPFTLSECERKAKKIKDRPKEIKNRIFKHQRKLLLRFRSV